MVFWGDLWVDTVDLVQDTLFDGYDNWGGGYEHSAIGHSDFQAGFGLMDPSFSAYDAAGLEDLYGHHDQPNQPPLPEPEPDRVLDPVVTTGYPMGEVNYSFTGLEICYQSGGGGGQENEDGEDDDRSCSHSAAEADESQFPANVEPNELRSAALELGDELWTNRNGDGGTGNEWVALILRGPAGNLETTAPFQGDSPVSVSETGFEAYVDGHQNLFNAGYQVVGWVHTQSQPLPSTAENSADGGNDWQVHRDLRDAQYDNFVRTVKVSDPNLMLYVMTDDGNLYEYTNEDENTETPGDRVGNRTTDCQG